MDLAISPEGALYVACHSGPPDWRTGPTGPGKLFKITYTNPKAPQPIDAWTAGPMDLRVAFDRSLDPTVLERLSDMKIEFGEFLSAGDRHEILTPPYSVVQRQEKAPRGSLQVVAADLTQDGRVLQLTTEPHSLDTHYALTIGGVKARSSTGPGAVADLDYNLRAGPPKRRDEHPQPDLKPQTNPLPAWAMVPPQTQMHSPEPEYSGGDFERGRELFFDQKLQCARCHRLRGDGGEIGPDLSNLVHRDAANVLRDIRDPNSTLHPDYVAYQAIQADGETVVGFVRAQGAEAIRFIGADGQETSVERNKLSKLQPSAVSLMPSGLLNGLLDQELRDLLTFLLHEPPRRGIDDLPVEIRGALKAPAAIAESQPLHVVIVASEQDYGAGQHDYPAWRTQWKNVLERAKNLTVAPAWEWPSAEQFEWADVLVFYCWNNDWNPERYHQLDDYQARGGGVARFHSAVIADKDPEQLAARIGLSAQPGRSDYLHTPFDLRVHDVPGHRITHGLPARIPFLDEPYWLLIGDPERVRVLASTDIGAQARPMMWTFEKGRGRVFATILGHYTWTLDDPHFRLMALRGIAWAAGERTERLAGLTLTRP